MKVHSNHTVQTAHFARCRICKVHTIPPARAVRDLKRERAATQMATILASSDTDALNDEAGAQYETRLLKLSDIRLAAPAHLRLWSSWSTMN